MIQVLIALTVGFSVFAADTVRYPTNPDPTLTPGTLCTTPNSYRYAEHIPYCERNVSNQTKWEVINTYDKTFNYNIDRTDRGQFKIDHRIPLCAGGSNDVKNLWPQHESVYTITDPLEQLACDKMAQGRLLQRRAVELLNQAKEHLEQASSVQKILESL